MNDGALRAPLFVIEYTSRMARGDVVYEDATMRQVFCRNMQIVAWFDAPTLEQMHNYGRHSKILSERFHGGSCLMNIVVGGTPSFSPEVLQAAAKYTREGAHEVGAAHVMLVSGLLGSSVRAFLSTIMLLGRPPNRTKVFGDLPSAASWMHKNLAELSSQSWRLDEIVEACRFATERDDVASLY